MLKNLIFKIRQDHAWDILIILSLIIALILRTYHLGIKPAHFDEGINGFFVAKMWKDGFYQYDPTNFHGPLYFYVLLIAEVLCGKSIEAYRFVNAIISLGCLALIAAHRRFFGAIAIWATIIYALSASAVFYARYAIHEVLFISFAVFFSFAWFLYRQEQSRRAVAMMIGAVFGAFAVKETYFIFFIVWMIAIAMNRFWENFVEKYGIINKLNFIQLVNDADLQLKSYQYETVNNTKPANIKTSYWTEYAATRDWWLFIAVGGLTTTALYSGFFVNNKGMIDMLQSVFFWLNTGAAGKSGHEKPFLYWIDLLITYELPLLFALLVTPLVFGLSNWRMRIMTMVAVGMWLAYSLIPYKTPWLILNFTWPLAFVFGAFIEILRHLQLSRNCCLVGIIQKIMVVIILISFAANLRVNFYEFTNDKEKYVYVQTTMAMKQVIDIIERHVKEHPEELNMQLFILIRDQWPLPWLFSFYPQVKFGKVEEHNFNNAAVVLIDNEDRTKTEERLKGKYWRLPFQVRNAYEQGFAYLAYEKFKHLLPADAELITSAP